MVNILKFVEKMVYVENKAVKKFLYYLRVEKYFVIFNNLHYMTSNNPFKKALGWIVVFSFIYMTIRCYKI